MQSRQPSSGALVVVLALTLAAALTADGCSCGCGDEEGSGPPATDARPDQRRDAAAGADANVDQAATADGPQQRWVVLHAEDFEALTLPQPGWTKDTYPDDGPFSDQGAYFKGEGVKPPLAYRASAAFGHQGWLTLEAYSRSGSTKLATLATITSDPDPAAAANKVLRISPQAHTDALVVRPSAPLPARYRVSLRVGHADFGDGKPGANGYDGGEQAEPWIQGAATEENGFYWLAILDAPPRPHNNVWIHHHRKVVIDSDNHYPAWMEIFTGAGGFVSSGVNPVMIFGVTGQGQGAELTGKPFVSWANGAWQPADTIRAADAYRPKRWYRVSIERSGDSFTLTVSGDFSHGGTRSYSATIDAAKACLWHYNTAPLPATSPCLDSSSYPSLGAAFPHWPGGKGWPDYFMFGDPHANYYEGEVFYDDLRLEVWQQG